MDNLLSRISTVLKRQDFRMCVPPESDDTDIVLEECRDAIESLRQQLAAALAACEAKDTILRGITLYRAFNGDDWPAREATQALAIKPDSSALRQHDDALIERCAAICDKGGTIGAALCAEAIRELKESL